MTNKVTVEALTVKDDERIVALICSTDDVLSSESRSQLVASLQDAFHSREFPILIAYAGLTIEIKKASEA